MLSLAPFNRWENRGWPHLSNLPEITQPSSVSGWIWTEIFLTLALLSTAPPAFQLKYMFYWCSFFFFINSIESLNKTHHYAKEQLSKTKQSCLIVYASFHTCSPPPFCQKARVMLTLSALNFWAVTASIRVLKSFSIVLFFFFLNHCDHHITLVFPLVRITSFCISLYKSFPSFPEKSLHLLFFLKYIDILLQFPRDGLFHCSPDGGHLPSQKKRGRSK